MAPTLFQRGYPVFQDDATRSQEGHIFNGLSTTQGGSNSHATSSRQSLRIFVGCLQSFGGPRSGKMGQDETKTAQEVASVTRDGSQDGPKAAP